MKKLNGKRGWIALDVFLLLIVGFVFTFGFSYNSVIPVSGEKKAIYKGNPSKKQVSLMFNVYENAEVVNKIVDVLDSFGVKGTFFIGGCWADDNEKTLLKISESGHEIGCHGYFHRDHAKLDYDGNFKEMETSKKVIESLSGKQTKLFAPPSGSFSSKTLDSAENLGYKVIMWSKDTIDWRDTDKKVLYSRATKNPCNGDLILMHPKEHTLLVLSDIISFYLERGFSLVTVSENII